MSSVEFIERSERKESDNIHRLGFQFRPIAIALNIILASIFGIFHIWPLVISYIASIFLSAWLAHKANQKPDKAVGGLKWIWLVVLLQSIFAVVVIGTGADFQFYAITTLPMIFANECWSLSAKIIQAAIIGLFLVFCTTYFGHAQTFYQLHPMQITFLRSFNAIGISTMLAALSYKVYLTLKETELKLQKLASTDMLTGLLNRRRIVELADQEFARSKRFNQPFSLIIGDIDHFKQINDTHGHEVGDSVLQSISAILENVRAYDNVARWGGEEFLLILPSASVSEALEVATRVCKTVAQTPIDIGNTTLMVTMTFGIAQIHDNETWQSALVRADQALYRGKNAGRNRCELA